MADRGAKGPDFKVRAPAGPGGIGGNRTDLAGNQPIRVPTGLPYGRAKELETLQQSRRIGKGDEAASLLHGGPSPAGSPTGPGSPTTGQQGAINPQDLISLLSHPTSYPGRMQMLNNAESPAGSPVSALLTSFQRQGAPSAELDYIIQLAQALEGQRGNLA